jgi:hypothetical protein
MDITGCLSARLMPYLLRMIEMKRILYCERCGAILNPKTAVMLEYNGRIYTDKPVPEEESQGGFWFGKDCAKIELAKEKTDGM